mmetsp:Transcript_57292/g.166248  ORF Transcript_57292/g.166248 Transcript_57292/m.166248 type:complete len:214 (+) Transcript_57292:366-1007(+)
MVRDHALGEVEGWCEVLLHVRGFRRCPGLGARAQERPRRPSGFVLARRRSPHALREDPPRVRRAPRGALACARRGLGLPEGTGAPLPSGVERHPRGVPRDPKEVSAVEGGRGRRLGGRESCLRLAHAPRTAGRGAAGGLLLLLAMAAFGSQLGSTDLRGGKARAMRRSALGRVRAPRCADVRAGPLRQGPVGVANAHPIGARGAVAAVAYPRR